MNPYQIVESITEAGELSCFLSQVKRFAAYVRRHATPQRLGEVLRAAHSSYHLQAHILEYLAELIASGRLKVREGSKEINRACAAIDLLASDVTDVGLLRLQKLRSEYIAAGREEWLKLFTVTHRDAPALAAMDDISWCRAAREKHATLRWNQEACENADSTAEAKPPRVTRSQRGIINALNDYWEILNDSRPVADVQAREKALIVAPTGCGKSFCIREFARLKNLPAFETEPNIWIPQGARYDRPTISELHTFVVTNDCGIIFIDEVDKLLAECDYMIAVRQEIYSLLDGVRRGYSIFTDAEKEKVRRRFLLVGAGTWQSLFAARSVGFQQHREAVTIEKQRAIPEELFRRFGAIHYLQPPDQAEFRSWILDIYRALQLPEPDADLLARQAVESELHCRWVEDHVTSLLRDPEIRRRRTLIKGALPQEEEDPGQVAPNGSSINQLVLPL